MGECWVCMRARFYPEHYRDKYTRTIKLAMNKSAKLYHPYRTGAGNSRARVPPNATAEVSNQFLPAALDISALHQFYADRILVSNESELETQSAVIP